MLMTNSIQPAAVADKFPFGTDSSSSCVIHRSYSEILSWSFQARCALSGNCPQSAHRYKHDSVAAGDTSSIFQYPQRVPRNHVIDFDLPVLTYGSDVITRPLERRLARSHVQRALKHHLSTAVYSPTCVVLPASSLIVMRQ